MSDSEVSLGRLQKIGNVRDVWKDEARDFTPWLAKDENIRLLGDTIGLELEVVSVEKAVGPFSADILCMDLDTDSYVLIENQLERTDHRHLGQLMTYAAGLEAVTIVWIADRFTDEHRAALDWLNEKTDDALRFFGLEIELWRIGSSPIAPKFNVISKPNEWVHSVKESVSSGELSDKRTAQLAFWTKFYKDIPAESPIRLKAPQARHWMPNSIGKTGFTIYGIASTSPAEVRVDFKIDDKSHFAQLQEEREIIDRELGGEVEWKLSRNQKSTLIIVRKEADILDVSQHPVYIEWLRHKIEVFYSVFSDRIRSLDHEGYDLQDADSDAEEL